MGSWGVLAFDNDNAGDWAFELVKCQDLSLVESALAAVEQEQDYIEAPAGEEALAACEVLARLLGRPGYQNAYTQDVDRWVRAHPQTPTPELLARADAVITRVQAENSELRELWEDTELFDEWHAAVEELRGRLGA